MNIKRAKEEIEHTVKAYLAKDALGERIFFMIDILQMILKQNIYQSALRGFANNI